MQWDRNLKIKQLEQISNDIKRYIPRQNISWVKCIREALGMSAKSLGNRIGLSQSRVSLIEQGERNKTITLKTLEKIADGLGCELVYSLVPKGSNTLSSIIEQRAYEKAKQLDNYTETHMLLEDQGTTRKMREENINKLVQDILTNDKNIWDDV